MVSGRPDVSYFLTLRRIGWVLSAFRRRLQRACLLFACPFWIWGLWEAFGAPGPFKECKFPLLRIVVVVVSCDAIEQGDNV